MDWLFGALVGDNGAGDKEAAMRERAETDALVAAAEQRATEAERRATAAEEGVERSAEWAKRTKEGIERAVAREHAARLELQELTSKHAATCLELQELTDKHAMLTRALYATHQELIGAHNDLTTFEALASKAWNHTKRTAKGTRKQNKRARQDDDEPEEAHKVRKIANPLVCEAACEAATDEAH